MPVVVVESPAKAKTINKYLGSDYTVLASYGHVRDLPPKDGSVDPEHEFDMKWEIASDSKKHVKAIADALKDDNALILATDPDREGEAISWHLEEALRGRKAIKAEPDNVAFLDSMGWVHYRLGNRDQARDYLQQALDLRLDPEIAAHLGEVLWMMDRHEEARSVWERGESIDTKNKTLRETLRKFVK